MYLKIVVTSSPKFWLVTLTYKVQTSVHWSDFISLKRILINFLFYIPTSSNLIDGNPFFFDKKKGACCVRFTKLQLTTNLSFEGPPETSSCYYLYSNATLGLKLNVPLQQGSENSTI